MTLQQCRYLVEIAKHNSLSKAASALFVTQPSVSKAVSNLEEELNITILDRTNKGVFFTEQGRELLFYAKKLIEQMESVVYHFNKQSTQDVIKYSISSQHYGFAIKAIAIFMEHLTDQKYELSVREGKTTEVINDIHTNRSILGILSLTDLNRPFLKRYFASKSLSFTPLTSIQQHVFLRKEHPLAESKLITLEQLNDFPYLTYQQDDMMLHFAEEALNLEGIQKIVYLKDRGSMNNLLSNTDGYNLGTGCIVNDYMNPNIISIPLSEGSIIQLGLMKRNDISLPKEILDYVEFLKITLKKSLPR